MDVYASKIYNCFNNRDKIEQLVSLNSKEKI